MTKPTAEDLLLEDFFEKLQITSNDEKGSNTATDSSAESQRPGQASISSKTRLPKADDTSPVVVRSQRSKERRALVNRAENGKQSWQEFCASESNRKKVSFKIGGKNKAKTTKKKASAMDKDRTPLPPASLASPQWIAVLDTCALLESYDAVRQLIATAARGGSALEPVTVVIPYKVWDELDYQKKHGHDDGKQYRARRASQMLIRNDSVIQWQSRDEMNDAMAEFLKYDLDQINNDDHILFCARTHRQKLLVELNAYDASVGEVVLLTWDNVLSGKAHADHIEVSTPTAFIDHYKRREASIRDRAAQYNMDVALQR